ncbi:MAG TPA: TonB-dependent receptor [Sphingomonas sp.]|uniref:TonB-dependent receptor domain-containing protein n=1 Tax=Sphingomonas sp. TaxID=28214 RepID=UPI002ED7C39B
MKLDIRNRLLASTLLAGAALVAQPAFAQATDSAVPAGVQTSESAAQQAPASAATDDTGNEIVVTGSLIRNPNLVASAPVQAVGENEIQLRQVNVAEDILRTLPGVVPSIGSAVNNGNGGSSYTDLRNLGFNRNLVLLDGQRLTPAGLAGVVDLNNIPVALVERVDVLTGGAATTYGADAVAGVVNFITKRNFAGVEISASNQITERGDGNVFRTDVTIGANFDDGRGNAVFSIGYQQADPVFQGDRPYSISNIDSFGGGASGSGTSVPSRFTRPGSPTQQIDPATGALRTTFALFNFNPYNIFQTPFERFNMFGQAHYELSDTVEVYTRGLFSKNTVNTILAPGGAFGAPITINYSNPYLPAAARTQFCNANGLSAAQCAAAAAATSPTLANGSTNPNYRTFNTTVSRRTTELGPRLTSYTTQVFDYRAGVKLNLTDSIGLDIGGAYGESENNSRGTGNLRVSRLRQAALASSTTDCIGAADSGCVPVNLFGPEGSITAEQGAFLTGETSVAIRTSLAQFRALLSGDIGVSSPFASDPIGFAAGAEYRKYGASQNSDILSQTPGEISGSGGAAPNINGGYDVYEAYGELIAPLVSDKPFFHSLTLETGVRYSRYKVDTAGSPTFTATTYKAGGSWEPVDGIKLRGNYQRAVRAPNIDELFSPIQTALTNLGNDPCATLDANGVRVAPAPTGELRAVCLAQGATTATVDIITSDPGGQVNYTGGGNLNLKPEKSDSYTLGVVLQPNQFVPGLSITVDYFNIKVKDAISSPTPGDAIAACFGSGNTPATGASATDACTVIRRDPVTGALFGDAATVPGLFLASSNLGKLSTDGIDVGVNYRRDIGPAVLNFAFTGTWTHSTKFQATSVSLNRECVGYFSVNCGSLQPEYSWNVRTTATFGAVDLSLLWRHLSKFQQEPDDIINGNGPAFQGTSTALNKEVDFQKIGASDYFDLAGRFGVSDNLDITLTVRNLLDRKPPIVGTNVGSTSYNSGNTYPSTFDALGRTYAVSARVKF